MIWRNNRFNAMIDVIVKIRNLRAEMNVDPGKRIQVNLASSEPEVMSKLKTVPCPIFRTFARCERVRILLLHWGREIIHPDRWLQGLKLSFPWRG